MTAKTRQRAPTGARKLPTKRAPTGARQPANARQTQQEAAENGSYWFEAQEFLERWMTKAQQANVPTEFIEWFLKTCLFKSSTRTQLLIQLTDALNVKTKEQLILEWGGFFGQAKPAKPKEPPPPTPTLQDEPWNPAAELEAIEPVLAQASASLEESLKDIYTAIAFNEGLDALPGVLAATDRLEDTNLELYDLFNTTTWTQPETS